ncbi:DMT family transporter [Jannaschia sp. R86511]|uniref:EamA family transporter n=1 Tax=Jannaschia sp. R86511 TaxID=3093853 RepID=UPI0036D2A995
MTDIAATAAFSDTTAARSRHTRGLRRLTYAAGALVVLAAVSQQFGSAFAAQLFSDVGAAGVVTLRLVLAAAVLLVLVRPKVRGYGSGDWLTVVAFGVALAGLNTLFYEAIARIPLGPAVTFEILGPLLLSVLISRRWGSLAWAVLAFGGVAMLGGGPGGVAMDPTGIAYALGAGAMWAAYTLLSKRAGGRFPGMDGLALAMAFGALLTLPRGVASAGTTLVEPPVLLVGLAVALMSSVLPYGLELLSLRTLKPSTFAVLLSLNPVLAAIAGYLVLTQSLTTPQLIGMVLVAGATIGALRGTSPRTRGSQAQHVQRIVRGRRDAEASY